MTTRIVLAIVLTCVAAGAARAQEAPPTPAPRGLFGSDRAEPRARVALGWDVGRADDLQAAPGVDTGGLLGGWYSALRGDLTYRKTSRRMTFGAAATSSVQYYEELEHAVSDYGGAVAWETAIGGRTRFSATQGFTHTRAFQPQIIAALPADVGTAPPASTAADAVSRFGVSSSSTALGLTRGLGRRASMDFSGDLRLLDFPGSDFDLRAWGAHGRITQALTRRAALHLGYGQRVGEYGRGAEFRLERIHDVRLGIDYSRTLSARSRRMAINFTPGVSLVGGTEAHRPRLTAETSVSHPIGRTWNARLMFTTGLQFVDGFAQPFTSDAVTAGLGGYLGRRLQVTATGGYSVGEIGMTGEGTYRTYTGLAQAMFALSRRWALSLDYTYQQYRFAGDVALPGGLPGSLERHSARAGVRWQRPL